MMNLLARRINDDELTTGEGVEEEELTLWYLEQIEEELQSREDLESERELVRKVLKRMTKVVLLRLRLCFFTYLKFRTTLSCKFGATAWWITIRIWETKVLQLRKGSCTSCTRTVPLKR